MTNLKKVTRGIDVVVFFSATLAVSGILYEGLTLQWYPIVGILIMIMDYSFLASVLLNIFIERSSKWFKVNILSLILLVAAIGMKLADIDYSPVSLVIWYLYIWILSGIKTITVISEYVDLKE